MKISGDGEWYRKCHDPLHRREWLKVHFGISWKTRQILATAFSSSKVTDGNMLPELLAQAPKSLKECIGDGAYDNKPCYQATQQQGLKPIFPIRSGAVIHSDDPVLYNRNKAIDAIKNLSDGAKEWKIMTGYHRRSLVENAFFRLKTLFGADLRARKFSSQIVQMTIRINLLNWFMFKNA